MNMRLMRFRTHVSGGRIQRHLAHDVVVVFTVGFVIVGSTTLRAPDPVTSCTRQTRILGRPIGV